MRKAYILEPATGRTATFDAVLSETHEHSAEVTRHPVSSGATVSDHIILPPESVSLLGCVSNSPIGVDEQGRGAVSTFALSYPAHPISPTLSGALTLLKSAIGFAPSEGPAFVEAFSLGSIDKISDTYDLLLGWRDQGAILDVITSIRTYESMVVEGLSMPRDAPDMADISVTLTRIRRVSVRKVAAPKPKIPAAIVAQNKGAQATKEPPAAKSLAVKLLASAGAF